MSDLYLPAKVRHEIQQRKYVQQRQEIRALLDRLLDFDDPVCREWQPVLRRLDPLLRLGRARPQAWDEAVPVIPGFYHWVRENETAAPTVHPITDSEGAFMEPDSGLLRDLEAQDLQDPRVYAAIIARTAQRELEREAEKRKLHDEMNDEVIGRYLAGTRTQVLMSPDVPWSQAHAGRRARGLGRLAS